MSQAQANSSVFETQWNQLLPIYSLYMTLGVVAIMSNALACVIYVSSQQLRTRCSLLTVLSFADLVNGLAFVLSGAQRLNHIQKMRNVYGIPMVKRAFCAKQLHNILMVVGSQWPSCVVLCVGLERYIAVTYPFRYGAMRDRYIPFAVVCTTLFILVSVTVGVISGTVIHGNDNVYFSCTVNRSFGDLYGTVNYCITIFGHIFGFLFSCSAFHFATNRSQKMNIRLTLAISILSVCLVSIPNMLLYVAKFWKIDNRVLGFIFCLFCLRSALNFTMNGAFNRDFKARIRQLKAKIFQSRLSTEVTHINLTSSRS